MQLYLVGAVALWVLHLILDRAGRVQAPGRGHCVVLLGKTLYSQSASLHLGVKIGTIEVNAGG